MKNQLLILFIASAAIFGCKKDSGSSFGEENVSEITLSAGINSYGNEVYPVNEKLTIFCDINKSDNYPLNYSLIINDTEIASGNIATNETKKYLQFDYTPSDIGIKNVEFDVSSGSKTIKRYKTFSVRSGL